MKILVTGHGGMLAQALVPALRHAGLIVMGMGRAECDITQAAAVRQVLERHRPDIVINTAAYTAVDQAECEPEKAFAVNRDGVAYLAETCRVLEETLIHVSTDYVFDGQGHRPYRKDDATAPLGVYGQSKWEGEEAVRARHREHLILRTAWLYGSHGANFVTTMLRLGQDRSVLRVVHDQQGCPTWCRDVAAVLVALCQRVRQDKTTMPWGTYHYCSAGQTTWFHFARTIFAEARALAPLAVPTVVPIPTAAYPTLAWRPANSVLNCAKIQSAFGIVPPPWEQSLHKFMLELYA